MARIPDMIVPRVDTQPMQITPLRDEARAWQAPDVTTPIIRRTGEALSSAGAAMMRIGEVIQNRRDDTAVMKSDALLGEDQLNIIYGYKNQIGEAAEAGYEPTLKQFDERRRKIEAGLENATQRTLFGARADRRRLDLMNDAMAHRAAQSKVAKVGAAEASAKQFANDYVYAVEQGVTQPPDPQGQPQDPVATPAARAMSAKAQAINAIKHQWAEMRGTYPQGPDYQAYEKASLGALHGMAVDRLMALQKYDEAIGYVDAIPAGEIDEEPRTKMLAQVAAKRDQRDGLAVANEYGAAYVNAMIASPDATGNEAARNIGLGKMVDPSAPPEVRFRQRQEQREAAAAWMMSQLNQRQDLSAGAKRAAYDALEGTVKQAEERIAAYGNNLVESVKAKILNADPTLTATSKTVLTDDDREALRAINRLEEVLTWAGSNKRTVEDPAAAVAANALTNEELMDYAGPEELAKDWAKQLSPSSYQSLMRRYKEASGAALTEVDQFFLRQEKEIAEAAKRIWLNPSKEQLWEFTKAAQERLDVEAKELGKGKPDKARRQEIYDAVASEVVWMPGMLWGENKYSPLNLTSQERAKAYVPVITPSGSTERVYTRAQEDLPDRLDVTPAMREEAIKSIMRGYKDKPGTRRMPSEQEIAEWFITNSPTTNK